LARGAIFLARDGFDTSNEIQIPLKIFTLKTRREAAVVVRGQVLEAFILAGKESTTKGAVGNEGDAQFARGLQNTIFGITCPERVFRLKGGDGMNGMGTAESGWGSFRETEITNLTSADEIGHGGDGVLDGSVGVDAVLVVKIDGLHAEALEAGVTGGANIFGFATDAAYVGIPGVAEDGKFGGEENGFAAIADGLADEDFVVTEAVDVGSIEKVDAEFEGAVNGGDGFGVIARTAEFGHAHAAETDGGNGGAIFSELTGLHVRTSQRIFNRLMDGQKRKVRDKRFHERGEKMKSHPGAIVGAFLAAIICGATFLLALRRQLALVEVAASVALGAQLYFLSAAIGDGIEKKKGANVARLLGSIGVAAGVVVYFLVARRG
jgi:hypothetical protein